MFSIMAGPSKRGMELPSPQHAEEEKGADVRPFLFSTRLSFSARGGSRRVTFAAQRARAIMSFRTRCIYVVKGIGSVTLIIISRRARGEPTSP